MKKIYVFLIIFVLISIAFLLYFASGQGYIAPFSDNFNNGVAFTNWKNVSGAGWINSNTACGHPAGVYGGSGYSACAESGTLDRLNLTNNIDLTGYTNCILTYYYLVDSSFDAGEIYNVSVQNKTGEWINIFSCTNGNTACENDTWNLQTYNITSGIGLNNNFNMQVSAQYNDAGEEAGLDNVLINCSYVEIYPQFYNYIDNNATQTGTGTGFFNVTVNNTNGTVILNINGNNHLATNLTASVYNASHIFASSGTFVYNWTAYGNGTGKNINISNNRYYTVNATLDTCTPPASGNWNLTCSDNCTFNTNVNIPANMTINGNGILTLKSNWTFTGTNQYIIINPICQININSGGGFRSPP